MEAKERICEISTVYETNRTFLIGCDSQDANPTLDLVQLKDAKVTDYEIGDDRLGDDEWNVITESMYDEGNPQMGGDRNQ